MYKIRYTYINPSNAGPFYGWAYVDEKYAQGDTYFGPFGRAVVKSCRLKPCKKVAGNV